MNQEHVHESRLPLSIKLFFVLIWGMWLCINTWTSSLEGLLRFHFSGFTWHASPNFEAFFNFSDFALIHPYFIFIKLGHFIGFGIMDALIYSVLKNHKRSLLLSISFAFSTEILQLFFGRDGRFYDLCIDSLGILTVYVALTLINRHLHTHR